MRRHNFILLACLTLFNTQVFSVQTIPLWTYYDFPPFIINAKQNLGLVYDLAALLSKQTQGEFQFVVRLLPRNRLEQKLSQHEAGIVAFVSPMWFKGDYLWSPKLLLGRNDVISLQSQSIEYMGPMSLKGRHITGLLGHKYPGIDKLVRLGDIKRSDVIDVATGVKTLLKGRADLILLPRVAALYQFNKLKVGAKIYYSKKPQYSYFRHLFFQPKLKPVYSKLTPVLNNLYRNPQWLATLRKYNLQSLIVLP